MIVRKYIDARKSARSVVAPNWESVRMLLAGDGMGYSFHITTVFAGTENEMEYRHHLETCYCIEGEGEIENVLTGEKHRLEPGTMYALDRNDRHIVRVKATLMLACVFNPPLRGRETHDETGSFPPPPTTLRR